MPNSADHVKVTAVGGFPIKNGKWNSGPVGEAISQMLRHNQTVFLTDVNGNKAELKPDGESHVYANTMGQAVAWEEVIKYHYKLAGIEQKEQA